MAKNRVTVLEASKIFGVAKSTIMHWIKKGKIIDAKKDYHGFYFWDVEDFKSFLARDYAYKVSKFEEMING